jgi:Flp pilus assembly protein TadD
MPAALRSASSAAHRAVRAWRLVVTCGAVLACLGAVAATPDRSDEIRALLARGEAAQALVAIDAALAEHPRDAALIFLRGVALMDSGREADALGHFERMTQEYPTLADPWNNIALLHARANRLELARRALDTALRNDPQHRTARANLGWVHLMLAAEAWQTLADSGPIDRAMQQRLETVRALLAGAAR